MKKHKATEKKQELQERLATMLKEDVLSKKEYVSTPFFHFINLMLFLKYMQDAKIKSVNNNSHLIEEAVDNPEEMGKIELKLGIVSKGIPEVHTLSDMTKLNPVEK